MGRILLCTGKYAKNPYYVESFCANVYCVEELCYLFMSNPFSIDRDIMDKKLAEWLDEECGLSELGHQLLKLFQRGSQPGIFVGMILDYVNYCTPEEKEKIEEVLQNNAGLTDYEKAGGFSFEKRQAEAGHRGVRQPDQAASGYGKRALAVPLPQHGNSLCRAFSV